MDTDECNHMVRWLQSWPSIAWAFAQILYNTGPYYFCIFLDSDTPPKCASWKRQRGMRNCRTRIRGLSCPGHHGKCRGICSINRGERRVGDAARMGDDVPLESRHLDSTGIAGGGVASHSRHPVIAAAVVWETCGSSSGSAIQQWYRRLAYSSQWYRRHASGG